MAYKPTTPGQRGLVLIDRSELWKGRPLKALTEGLSKKGGRNNTGRITNALAVVAGPNGSISVVDFKRSKFDLPATVERHRVRSQPHRVYRADKIRGRRAGLSSWLLAQRLAIGDQVVASAKADVKPGNAMPFSGLPIGKRLSTTSR